MSIVSRIKKIIPDTILAWIYKTRQKPLWRNYEQLTTKQVFTKIYSEQVWGNDSANPGVFFSGGGSHDAALIDPYITAVKKFIAGLESKPDVMDLGCGDFNIGSQIREVCNKYIACDIVDNLIERNKVHYKNLDTDFRVFDLTKEQCDKVDIIFVRQVFQHLSNDDIKSGLNNIIPFCKYLIVTEHLPAKKNFKRNADKPTGPDTRTLLNSGIDITYPPFNYSNLQAQCICEVSDDLGLIQTIVYKCN